MLIDFNVVEIREKQKNLGRIRTQETPVLS